MDNMDEKTKVENNEGEIETKDVLPQDNYEDEYYEDEEVFVDIQDLIKSGTKFYALRQYDMAIDRFSHAINILVNQYGEFSPQCAPIYFYYGQALLQKAIQQNDVFGEKIDENVQIKENNDSIKPNKSMNRFTFQGDEEDEEESPEQEEDLFESAWQILDMCRIIYEKDTTIEGKKKLGDVIKTLGDVYLEDGNYIEAAKNYEEGINILDKILEPDDRTLAEAHYKLALALECNQEGEKAVYHMKKAIIVLKKKLESLEKLSGDKGKGKAVANNETINAQEESEGIKELLVEMKKKLTELKSLVQKTIDVKEMLSNTFKSTSTTMNQNNQEKVNQINDLSNLIKKRKSDSIEKTSTPNTTTTTNTTTSENKTSSTVEKVTETTTTTEKTEKPETKKIKLSDDNKDEAILNKE